MLNLKILRNLSQSNLYRDEASKEGVRQLEQALLGERISYTPAQAAEHAGVELEHAEKVWRNMGFPNLLQDSPYFTDRDVTILSQLEEMVTKSTVAREGTFSLVRSVGQLTDRIVAWQIEALVEGIMIREKVSDADARRILLHQLPELMDALEALTLYAYRRQMYTGVLRLALRENNPEDTAPHKLPLMRGVGFVDLVSYTSLVRNLNARELSHLINHFEQSCLDIIGPRGGRIIKTLGDEVFFLTESPEMIADISLALAEEIGADEQLPAVRVAFIWGEVLANRGDVYGSSVNMASRLVSQAEPGTVLTDADTARMLAAFGDRFNLVSQGTRNVRSFGNVDPVAVSRGTNSMENK
ncbi:MAG: adenylate/guanylate cyclase domain-containing protein [Rothia sp. (in: high G+C Gram-positive bacteria)]|uniref:adenylate/guanylate cyclase domain-containing protein n=1 Tax=Rothia sp. (in: high G+C Gram-positive bacteria) TaxID=1885016 RepID=UPI0026DEC37E|nr:adenylate/guanylate cyclase domain-containing protein [Rothia sp. (in: high G+C Gram-positive bacteria)]MDO5750344.1 adenylate/guanylate cyclase domain-containing protein [Rothia sp. (in: high G+C Gram-positive bacteria)]